MDVADLLTVKQIAELNPALTESTVRWWIFNAEKNGFDACIVRVGSKVLIDRTQLEKWLESHRAGDIADGPPDGGK